MNDITTYSPAETAKLVRKALKTAFPAVKFWVKTETYSMGAHVDVRWVDGPTEEEVKAITSQFEGARFDPMEDLKEYVYRTDENGNPVRYGADYVTPERFYSPEAMQEIVAAVRSKWDLKDAIKIEEHDAHFAKNVRTASVGACGYRHVTPGDLNSPEIRDAIWQMRRATSWLNRAPGEAPEPESAEEPIEKPLTCSICGAAIDEDAPEIEGCPVCEECAARAAAFETQRQARIERLEERAAAKHQQAATTNQTARQMAKVIPFGQPILQGHHSEGRDRRYRQRIQDTFRKAYEESQAAERLDDRAAAAAQNKAISSDDPAAVIKLREKLVTAEALQARMKAANRVIRQKTLADDAKIAALVEQGFTDAQARELLQPDFAGRLGFAPYQLQNNSANIRRMKQRLAGLQAQVGRETTTEEAAGIPGLEIVRNAEENRLQLVFAGKPPKAIRAILKSHGWRWAPSQGAWQRHLNNASETALQWTLTSLKEVGPTPPNE